MSVNPAFAQRSKAEGYFMARWTFLISTLMVTSPAIAQPQNWLVGTWKLVSATQTENGQSKEYFGPRQRGQVILRRTGSSRTYCCVPTCQGFRRIIVLRGPQTRT